MSRIVGGDRYDAATVACVVAGAVVGLTVGPWYLWLLVGFAAGNLLGALLRRRAGVPDRSALGRLRGGGSVAGPPTRPSAPPQRVEREPPPDGDRGGTRPRAGRAGTEWREGRRRSR